MQNEEAIEFTNREKFILSYYRDEELSASRLTLFFDIATVLVSLLCLFLYLTCDQEAYGFVAYGLLLCRLLYLTAGSRRWNAEFRSIFAKYEARVRELSASKLKATNDSGSPPAP